MACITRGTGGECQLNFEKETLSNDCRFYFRRAAHKKCKYFLKSVNFP